jgi:hypothetical protein
MVGVIAVTMSAAGNVIVVAVAVAGVAVQMAHVAVALTAQVVREWALAGGFGRVVRVDVWGSACARAGTEAKREQVVDRAPGGLVVEKRGGQQPGARG